MAVRSNNIGQQRERKAEGKRRTHLGEVGIILRSKEPRTLLHLRISCSAEGKKTTGSVSYLEDHREEKGRCSPFSIKLCNSAIFLFIAKLSSVNDRVSSSFAFASVFNLGRSPSVQAG